MKKLLFLLFSLILFSFQTNAGGILGGELTYNCVAPGVYTVRLTYVHECSAVPTPATLNLQISSPGCTSQPRTVVINKTGTENLIQYYCNRPNMSACAPFNQPGTAFSVLYTGVV